MNKLNFPKWLRNKYLIVLSLFVVYVLFLVDADIITIIKRNQYLDQLEVEKEVRSKRIESLRSQKTALENNESIERFAREEYRFRKKDEDVIVIVKD